MPHAIRVHEYGGPEVMKWEPVEVGHPGPGEIRLRQTAVGLNFVDTYQRTGFYKIQLPAVLGQEGAGVVEAVGAGVSELRAGDRVAYAGPLGAYAEERLIAADRVVKLPDGISDEQAAAMMLKGLTAAYLLRRVYKVQRGETILLHAAAGGVGLLMCQWARALGVTVIGTVSSDEKARLAAEHGCTHPIVYTREDFALRTLALTGGAKVPVAYDSVGRDTFMRTLDCIRPRGLAVTFGQASGPIPPFDLVTLSQKGSLFLTRPSLAHYTADRAELGDLANELFALVERGDVKIVVNQRYPLREAARAHRDLESRKTTGSTVLTV